MEGGMEAIVVIPFEEMRMWIRKDTAVVAHVVHGVVSDSYGYTTLADVFDTLFRCVAGITLEHFQLIPKYQSNADVRDSSRRYSGRVRGL